MASSNSLLYKQEIITEVKLYNFIHLRPYTRTCFRLVQLFVFVYCICTSVFTLICTSALCWAAVVHLHLQAPGLSCGSNTPQLQETSNTCPITSIVLPSNTLVQIQIKHNNLNRNTVSPGPLPPLCLNQTVPQQHGMQSHHTIPYQFIIPCLSIADKTKEV